MADLQRTRVLPSSSSPDHPDFTEMDEGLTLGDTFCFAETSDQISTLEEASSLLLLVELKNLAKEAKVQGKNKKELLAALRQTSKTQTGLSWGDSSKNDTELSIDTNRVTNGPILNIANRDEYYIRKILDHTGDCIRLTSAPLKLFERVHLVFYRSTQWTEKSLTAIILAKISRRNYPQYIVSRSTGIFPTRSALLEFEAALRTQFQVDSMLELNGAPTQERLESIQELCEKVYPRWKELLEEEQRKEERVYETGEGAYLRRFSPAWVYTRIVHKGLYPLGRFKQHKREHDLLRELLSQRLFHASRRGNWYQRKALLEEHYMWVLTPSEGRAEDAQKKHWKRLALQTCEDALRDPDCHLIYHHDLQKRIQKLEKALKIPKREQHDFAHVMLVKPEERMVHGIRIEKEETNGKLGSKPNGDATRRGRPTAWVDEREGGECRVEGMCLGWYRDNGWKGYHAEGGIVRTLVSLRSYTIVYSVLQLTHDL